MLPGADSVGYGISSTVPKSGTNLNLAVATAGRLDLARIAVMKSGRTYTTSLVTSMVLPSGAATTRAPYWCPAPCGPLNQAVIAVGGANGLYLFNGTLTTTLYLYSGGTGGVPPITTTPAAGPNGDWYFGRSERWLGLRR